MNLIRRKCFSSYFAPVNYQGNDRKKNMPSRRVEHGQQNYVITIFLKGFIKTGQCVRTTFRTTPKIAGKTHFFIF